MKLSNVAFARVISYISSNFGEALSYGMIEDINDLIDFDVPSPPAIMPKASEADVNALLSAFAAGDRKIEAIKAYRNLTGAGLKESKDAIERYQVAPSDQVTAKEFQFQLLDRVFLAEDDQGHPDHILRGFSTVNLKKVYDYISSFTTYK